MASLQLITHFSLTINGQTISAGSRSTPDTITFSSSTGIKTFNVASGASQVVFDRGASGELSVMDFAAWFAAAGSAFIIEFKTDGALPNYWLEPVTAGVWHIRRDGAAYRDYGTIGGTAYTQFTSGTPAEVDTITVKNTGGSAADFSFLACKT